MITKTEREQMTPHSFSYGVETENHLGYLTEYYHMSASEIIRKLLMKEYADVIQYQNDMNNQQEQSNDGNNAINNQQEQSNDGNKE